MKKIADKLIPFEKLGNLGQTLHQQQLKIVTTNGCFDLLHWGHIKYLNEAKLLGDILICAINSDRTVTKLKGEKRPIFDEKTRALQVASLEAINYVSIFDQDTPEDLIRILKPAVHVKGGDYTLENLPERLSVEECGGKIVILPHVEGFSTTMILKKLR